jgi:NitT/TauT family transport system permease protein
MPEKSLLSKVKYQLTTHSLTIATFAVIFLVWELAVQIFNINRVVLPAPSEIATVMLNLQKGYYVPWDKHISVTLFEILAGFSLAAVVGILLAMLIVYSLVLERILLPLIVFIQVLPKIAVAPLFLIWVGYGMEPKIGIAFLIAFFPIVVSTANGLREVEQDLLDLMSVYGATKTQVFFKVRFPNAVPHIMSGLSIGMASAVIGAIVGEFVAANEGLGFLIVNAQYQLLTAMAFASLFYIAIIGLVLYGAVVAFGNLLKRF